MYQTSKKWKFDIYESIRAVNWLRREVHKQRRSLTDEELVRALRAPFDGSERPPFLDDDNLLHPFLPDDALLPALSCEVWGGADSDAPTNGSEPSGEGAVRDSGASDVDALREENQRLREALAKQAELIEAVVPSFRFASTCPGISSSCNLSLPCNPSCSARE